MQITSSTARSLSSVVSSSTTVAEALPKKGLLIAAGVVALVGAGIAAAIIGPGLIKPSPPDDGRSVGTSHGYRMVDLGGGRQAWTESDGGLSLGRHRGAAEGYASLADALAGARANQPNTDDMAFLREDGQVHAYQLKPFGLEAIVSFTATDPAVIAYTSPDSGAVFAGPAATAEERAANGLVDRG